MIQKWNYSNNEIFQFSPLSEEVSKFQGTKRVKWIKAIPELVNSINNDLTINITFSRCMLLLMSIVQQIILRAVKRDELSESEKLFIKWNSDDANLIGYKL